MSQDLPIPRQDHRSDDPTVLEWGDTEPGPPGRLGSSLAGLARDHRLPPLLAGLGAPLLIAVVWGAFCSPKAAVALPAPAKLSVQAACFVTGGLLLALAGRPVPGALLVALWALDKALLLRSGEAV